MSEKKKYDLCFLTKKKKCVRNNFAYGKITELSNNDKNYILTKQLRFMLLSNLCLNQILKLCVCIKMKKTNLSAS